MIVLSSQADVNFGDGLGAFGKLMSGIFDNDPSNISPGVPGSNRTTNLALGVLSKLVGNAGVDGGNFDPYFVDSGKQLVPGGSIQSGKIPPLENANVREIYNQTPQASILIKKRAFSSLSNLYVPALMDPDELWLFRATKKLFASKCSQVADMERLSKISKLSDQGVNTASLITNLVSSLSNDLIGNLSTSSTVRDNLGSYAAGSFLMEQIARAREPVSITTWFQDQTLPFIEEIGFGTGVFELTNISGFSTSLNISGEGNFNISIEDPYSTMLVNEGDIETAIRDTVLSGLISIADKTAGLSLASAQAADNKLSASRTERNVSQISFSMSIGNEPAVTAVLDSIGFKISPDNLNSIVSPHDLTSTEQVLFEAVYKNLSSYAGLSKKTLMSGSLNVKKHKKSIEYVRNNMRFAYLGKNMVQPMDKIHIFVDSGTRKGNEGQDTAEKNQNYFSPEGHMSIANSLGTDDTGVDESLIKIEWELSGKQLPFAQFKKIVSTYAGGVQIISGLVKSTTDVFDATGGLNTITIQGTTEMEWLKISQFNSQPTLDQTQGIVFDPLTPFDFDVNVATGLPTGKPELTDANKKRFGGKAKMYAHNGPGIGSGVLKVLDDIVRDVKQIGGKNIALADHAPGMIYKWKEGIITATYDMSTANKFDKTKTTAEQLRRDVGFFWSNTAFDNMDVANILSVLITGQPYNYISFLDSAVKSGSFIPDSLLNDSRDYFSVLQEIQGTINAVQGNFIPFKYSTITRAELSKIVLTQQKLTKQTSQLNSLRNEYAKLTDQQYSLQSPYAKDANKQDSTNISLILAGSLGTKIQDVKARLTAAENELIASGNDNSLSDNVKVYGNDVAYDYNSNVDDKNQAKLFGDNLIHATLKRKEDVIYNRDKTYFIVSDEYDKDYDVQAFLLEMKSQAPSMWESSWENVYSLCRKAVDILNFEFFANTQGHIEFRPPQYNRTPLTVFEAVLNYGQQTGANLLPDFLSKLFDNREVSMINEIVETEWRIRLKGALLGAKNAEELTKWLKENNGTDIQFISDGKSPNIIQALNRDVAISPDEKSRLLDRINKENNSTSKSNLGLFNPQAQYNLQKNTVSGLFSGSTNDKLKDFGNEKAYKEAVVELSKLSGKPVNNFEDFSKVKVGVSRNGVITPATDVARLVSDIAQLISQRSNAMRSLESLLKQRRDVGEINTTGGWNFTTGGIRQAIVNPAGLFGRLIEDDTRNTLGHLSKERFVIMDKDVIRSEFQEQEPEFTSVKVTGADPLIGVKGGTFSGGMPHYVAYGTDFDTWRQYGWRTTREFDRPFFWSAELQCAPYAKMLLSRARRNIVHGTLKIKGNEFYQLGDVVFFNERQTLFYVEGVSQNFDYESGTFTTTLTLKYGHPPGVYIPSPLDIIGKNISNKSGSQTSYRIRRERGRVDNVLGVVKFDAGKPNDLLGGTNGARNQSVLSRASLIAQQNINPLNKSSSSRLYIMGFGGDESVQTAQTKAVKNWFARPQKNPSPAQPNNISTDNQEVLDTSSGNSLIDAKMIYIELVDQTVDYKKLEDPARDLIKQGIIASNDSWLLDKTLETVVEIRLRPVPIGGWKK